MPLAALLALPLLISQTPAVEGPTIEGKVLDARTDIPIAGASVKLRYTTSPAAIDQATTGPAGTFRLIVKDAGSWVIEASAPGYQTALSAPAIVIEAGEIEAGAPPKTRSVTLKLSGTGAISGHIRDSETTKPLELITVRVLSYRWLLGKRMLTEATVVFTDADGAFRADNLTPGDYILEIQRNPPETPRPKSYPRVYWPPAGITVSAGVDSGAGTLDYARIQLPKVRVTVTSGCKEIQAFSLDVVQMVGESAVKRPDLSRTLPCAAPLPPLSLSPGHYRFAAAGLGPAGLRFASADVDAVEGEDRDVELRPPPASPTVSGRILCDCDRTSISVLIGPTPDSAVTRATIESTIRSDGTFTIPVSFAGPGIVEVRNLPAGYFVEKPASMTFAPGSAPFFEIELSDKPAKVTVTAPPGHVLLSPWPLNSSDPYSGLRTAEVMGDAVGFSDLPPGSYRAAWVPPGEWPRFHMPNSIQDWLAKSETFTLEEGEARSISISPKP